MIPIHEFAPAKINLTLEVAGRRGDGLHEIASLVTFADAGDQVTLDLGGAPGLRTTGRFADGLTGPNILPRTLTLIGAHVPGIKLGAVQLEKNLPVAAGIGGGSADAGALLRAVRRANGRLGAAVDWPELARTLGADVAVCLEARARWMTGSGGALADLAGGLPRLQAVLVNPMAAVPADKTAQVFAALGAGAVAADYVAPAPPKLADRMALLAFMGACGNQLAAAAERIVPDIGAVIGALRAASGVEHAAVSGAGPTCFGIFPDRESAEAAHRAIAARHRTWWVAAVQLG